MIQAFFQGWRTAFRSWRIVLIIYGFQFLFALTTGILAHNELKSAAGRSLELKKLLFDYDHTVIQDIANTHGDFLAGVQGVLPWLILGWVIFSIFINAGILFTITKRKADWNLFWAGGAKYFFPFLKIGIFFTALIALSSALIWLPLVNDWQGIIEKLPSEREYIFILIGVFVIYFFLLLSLFCWSVFARLTFIKEEKTIWQSIKTGGLQTIKKLPTLNVLLILFSAIQALIVFIYWQIESGSGMISPALIFVFFALQQMLIIFRISWKISVYRGLDYMQNKFSANRHNS